MNISINDFELYDCVVLNDNNEYIVINERGIKEWMLLENYDEDKNIDVDIDSQIFIFNPPSIKKKRGRPKKCNNIDLEKKSRNTPRKLPTKYNIFIKNKTKQFQEMYPYMDKKTRFKKILKIWNDSHKKN